MKLISPREIIVAAALSLATIGSAFAQAYPSKPVKVIMPYQPGGASDMMGRFYAGALTKELGQSFYVENRLGAGGNIGTAVAAKSPADGYTLVVGTAATHAINQAMYASTGYDPEADFDPIGMLGKTIMCIAVPADSGIRTLGELIDKSKQQTVNVAITGSMSQLVQELLYKQAGSVMVKVPYKGSSAAIVDMLGGHVHAVIDTASALEPHVKTGKFLPLGVTSLTHSDVLPTVKTVSEQGMPGFEVTGWFTLFAPKGTPPEIIAKLNAALKKIRANPETGKALLAAGFDLSDVGEPRDLSKFIHSEREKWAKVVKDANMRAE